VITGRFSSPSVLPTSDAPPAEAHGSKAGTIVVNTEGELLTEMANTRLPEVVQ